MPVVTPEARCREVAGLARQVFLFVSSGSAFGGITPRKSRIAMSRRPQMPEVVKTQHAHIVRMRGRHQRRVAARLPAAPNRAGGDRGKPDSHPHTLVEGELAVLRG